MTNTDDSSDGAQLFMMACGVWVSCAILIVLRREILLALAKRLLART